MISRAALLKHPLWVMHDGTEGQAHDDFVFKKYVSLESPRVGDLRSIPNTRPDFFTRYRGRYPRDSRAIARKRSSELYRFYNEMKPQDFVVYPSSEDKIVHIGVVRSDYEYMPNMSSEHPHIRGVEWREEIRRRDLPKSVRQSLGTPRALYHPSDIRKFCAALARASGAS